MESFNKCERDLSATQIKFICEACDLMADRRLTEEVVIYSWVGYIRIVLCMSLKCESVIYSLYRKAHRKVTFFNFPIILLKLPPHDAHIFEIF